MEPTTIIALAKAAMHSAEFIKKTVFDNRKMDELKTKTHEHVSSLAEQVELNRAIVGQVVEQLAEGKSAIEKHNEILLTLSEAAQSSAQEIRRLRVVAYAALVLSAVSLGGAFWMMLAR